METIKNRLNEEESRIFKKYAKLNNIPLPTLFKKSLVEKMEDQFDMRVITEYENSDSHETCTHEELKETL